MPYINQLHTSFIHSRMRDANICPRLGALSLSTQRASEWWDRTIANKRLKWMFYAHRFHDCIGFLGILKPAAWLWYHPSCWLGISPLPTHPFNLVNYKYKKVYFFYSLLENSCKCAVADRGYQFAFYASNTFRSLKEALLFSSTASVAQKKKNGLCVQSEAWRSSGKGKSRRCPIFWAPESYDIKSKPQTTEVPLIHASH